jgi:hypothetical protein
MRLLIRVSDPDPDLIRVGSGFNQVSDPDPYSESGSGFGSRRAKMMHKSRKNFRNVMF